MSSSPIRVGILTPTLSRTGGGIFPIVAAHARGLAAEPGIALSVFGIADQFSQGDARDLDPVDAKSYRPLIRKFAFARGLMRDVVQAKLDILHQHGLWQYPSLVSARFRAASPGRVVISTQGMLEPWAIANAQLKKKIAGWMFERRNLEAASCLHCSEAEVAGVRSYGARTPIAVIPNGVTLPDSGRDLPRPEWMAGNRRVLLFLGRIHPKKGVFELLQAWRMLIDKSEAARQGWRLAIAGWDDGGYAERLKQAARQLELGPDSVTFPGGIFGEEKEAAFRNASAFILPSFSEGLPMTVLEAWSYGLPVLMTRGCNLPAAFERDAAIEISTDANELSAALEQALTSSKLGNIAENGRRFVEEQFTWPAVIKDLRSVYEWLTGAASRPACVDT